MEQRTYDVAVIGAGTFGAWTAEHLRRAGRSVLLVDGLGPANARASSGGESRVIRMGYGADEIYTRMSMRSLTLWKELFQEIGQPLFHQAGVLFVARHGDPHSDATRATLERLRVPHEVVSHQELAHRWPQMHFADAAVYGIFEPQSGAIMARRSIASLVEHGVQNGMSYQQSAVAPTTTGELRTSEGEAVRADVYVFACGPWLPKLFPDLLGGRISPTRQEVFFFGPSPGDRRFAPPNLPVWVDFTDPRGPYGCPDFESRGFKVGFDLHGETFDPDKGDRRISTAGVEQAYRFLAERFPDLAYAPLVETRVCQYESTSSGDFLIDRHPDFENFWIIGGGSGHGFKHGPAVGEYVASRILDGRPVDDRFSLASKASAQNRTVF